MSECKRCGKELTGKSTVYCSYRCCKLYLKAMYKLRKGEHKSPYKPRLDEDKMGSKYDHDRKMNNLRKLSRVKVNVIRTCIICKSKYDIHGHHEDYNKINEITFLCRKHHNLYHQIKRLDSTFTIEKYKNSLKKGFYIVRFNDSPVFSGVSMLNQEESL